MMDLFESKNIKPMLIGAEGDPFDDADYIFELKLDGERCLAYLDPKWGTELRNKRNDRMLPKVPELSQIHKQVKSRCILDGELLVIVDGAPDFSEIQRRSLMSNSFKIELAAAKYPACFTAYDILYCEGETLTSRPLHERKELLKKIVAAESPRLAVSRIVEREGRALYSLAVEKDLEGIVAKRKDSRYVFDKRTTDWIKIKNLKDEDFLICGYIQKSEHIVSLVLGCHENGRLLYCGHVTMGVSREDFQKIAGYPKLEEPDFKEFPRGSGNDKAIWIVPELVCTVKFMEKTKNGSMRQPVFKGLRFDKSPQEV